MTQTYSAAAVHEVLSAMARAQLPPGASIEALLVKMCDILRDKVQYAELWRRVERTAELEEELRRLKGG